MRLRDARPRGRGAFTLIELLVVMAIIAVLISLTAAAVFNVFIRMDEVKARTELNQMAGGIKEFEADYNIDKPPPSRLFLDESGAYNVAAYPNYARLTAAQKAQVAKLVEDSKEYIHTVWPRIKYPVDWNGNGRTNDAPVVLEGQECLVFFLGGAKNANGLHIGFSTDETNPMRATAKRKGPYFQFTAGRLQAGPQAGYQQYLDPYGVKPYAYFSSGKTQNGYEAYNLLGSDCASLNATFRPYFDSPGHYWKPDTFQIISAGRDKTFGPGGMWTPTTTNTVPQAGRDDISNFYDRKLGYGQ
jgi:prepilin-type N-terminal cleavage/methylation domain-containing protein